MAKWCDWTELIFAPLTVAGTTADVKSKARVGLTGGKEKQAQDVAAADSVIVRLARRSGNAGQRRIK